MIFFNINLIIKSDNKENKKLLIISASFELIFTKKSSLIFDIPFLK